MGRPWWYDSYWEKKEKRRRRPRSPSRKSWAWLALVVLSLFLAVAGTGFQPVLLAWLLGFIGYFCRILSLAIFLRALLSWFRVGYYSWPMTASPSILPVSLDAHRIESVYFGIGKVPV